jgi:hypothetical protein
MLVCPHFTVTFYPAPYPSVTGPVALVATTDYVDPDSNVAVAVEQLAQREDYLRGEVPSIFARGNRSATLEWESVTSHATPSAAAAAGFEAAEDLPASVGWVHVSLAAEGRAWALSPAMLVGVATRHRKRGAATLLYRRWTVQCGPPVEIAVTEAAHAMLLETSYGLLTEDNDHFVLETLT